MRLAASLLFAALLAGGPSAQSPSPVQPLPQPPFDQWLAELRSEAISRGISEALIDRAFADVVPVESVLERDRAQAEFTLDLQAYLKRRLTTPTIRTARQMHTKHRSVLTKIEKTYGVPSTVLVSIWGLESNFGKFAGVRPTIPALVTLAYDPRRGAMFRGELFHALDIVQRGDIELEKLRGSWAGALGQPQFMPSSYVKWAQDFDGDGRKDIWSSQPDVFASIAYFLQQHGWAEGARWGREVKIPSARLEAAQAIPLRETGCRAVRSMTEPRSVTDWRTFGLRTTTGAPLPSADMPASLMFAGTRAFLVYDNYHALLGYNCANTYALSVAVLSDLLN
jgi:membrane-bound lytic murein transglycosylase B